MNNPINLGRKTQPQEAKDAFLKEVTEKGNRREIENAPRNREELVRALQEDVNAMLGDVEITDRKFLGLRLRDKVRENKVVITYDNVEIGYFESTPKGQRQLVRFLFDLYEFAKDAEKEEIIKSVRNKLTDMSFNADLVELEGEIGRRRPGAESTDANKQNIKYTRTDRRTTQRATRVQRRANNQLEKLNAARINEALAEFKETELIGIGAIIKQYMLNYQNLQQEMIDGTVDRQAFIQRMTEERQEFILALGYIIHTSSIQGRNATIMKRLITDDLNIPWRMVRRAQNQVRIDLNRAYRTSVRTGEVGDTTVGAGTERSANRRAAIRGGSTEVAGGNRPSTDVTAPLAGTILANNQYIANRYSGLGGGGRGMIDGIAQAESPSTTHVDREGNLITTVDYAKMSTDNLILNYLALAPSVLEGKGEVGALREAKQLSLGLLYKMMKSPREAQRIMDQLEGPEAGIDLMKRALGWSEQDQRRLHASYQRQLTQIQVQRSSMQGPDYVGHNFALGEAEQERALTDAFFGVFIDKYNQSMQTFLHGRNPFVRATANRDVFAREQLVGLFSPMVRTDFYRFIKNDFARDVDLEREITGTERTNGVATNGGVIDQWTQRSQKYFLDNNQPGAAKAVGAAGNLVKGAYKVAKVGSLIYGGFKLLKGTGRFLGRLVTGKGWSAAASGFTEEFKGAAIAASIGLGLGYLDGDKKGITGSFNNLINEQRENFFGDGSQESIRSTYETRATPREVVSLVFQDMTIDEITASEMLTPTADGLKLDISKLSSERQQAIFPNGQQRMDMTNLNNGVARALSAEFGITAATWIYLQENYPTTPLSELLQTYTDRGPDVRRLQGVIPNVQSAEQWIALRYMASPEFREKQLQLAFVAQQQQKLEFGEEYRNFAAQSGSVMYGRGHKVLVTRLQGTVDQENTPAIRKLKDLLQEYANTGDNDYLNKYFGILSMVFSDLYAYTEVNGEQLERRDYDNLTTFNDQLAGYFHNPMIGNTFGGNDFVQNPHIGARNAGGKISRINQSRIKAIQAPMLEITDNAWERHIRSKKRTQHTAR